ncbi:MAG: PASTA domain-containing protein [Clostridia bacterium]|nr:PASTA domain-containing protein [Clostridia bacterium]
MGKKSFPEKLKNFFSLNGSLNTSKGTQTRVAVAKIAFSAVMVLLVGHMAILQFVRGEELQEDAYNLHHRGKTISAARGNIYDRNGTPLAVTVSANTITVSRNTVKKEGEDYPGGVTALQKDICEKLSEVLDLEYETLFERIQKKQNYWTVATNVDTKKGDEIRAWANEKDLDSITVEDDTKRYYPGGSLASHVIGFTGNDDQGLVCGIEVALDEELSGTPGRVLSVLDASGNEIAGEDIVRVEPVQGKNVTLTIDATIQAIAEEALANAVADFGIIEGGAVIVMDPDNADVIAMASNPSFDLNDPWECPENIDDYLWDPGTDETANILSSFVWRNNALTDTYEPGSTFKSITACAALEENVVTPETTFSDEPLSLAGWTIHCWKRVGHGSETFSLAVANSCNPIMARAALRVGVDKYYEYVRSFGFTERTNILLSGEAVGVMHDSPTEIDLAVTAFGQRFTITPIQLATAYCAIANGGTLYEPRIVKELCDSEGNTVKTYETKEVRRVISEKTSKTVLKMLEDVVNIGGGNRAYVSGYRVAGKTGTSETQQTDSTGRYVVSFSAIAPADDPELVVLVVLDHPTVGNVSGGLQAARTAGEIVKKSLEYLGVEKKYSEADLKTLINVYMAPDLVEKSLADAIVELKSSSRHYRYEVVGDTSENATVVAQFPEKDTMIVREGTIILYTSEELVGQSPGKVRVPNLVGYTLDEAHEYVTALGLNMYAVSRGTVVEQDIMPGEIVDKGTVISLRLVDNDMESGDNVDVVED